MKLCFLAHGTSIHTVRWTRYFEDRGHDVSLITFTPQMTSGAIRVCNLRPLRPVSYKRANWHYLFRLPALRRFIRSIRPEVLCAHFVSSYGLMAALTCPRDIPLVTCIHGSDLLVFPKKSPLHRAMTRFALKRADLIILPAAHMKEDLIAYIGSGKSILTLQYGIDFRQFHPGEHCARKQQPVCISNRAMVPLSGVDTILGAAGILKSRGSPLRFLLADTGDQHTFLQKSAEEWHLQDIVKFEGRIDHEQMPAALRRASIYISMAHTDGASLSLMEAMACGLFPVVADIPANREWVSEGVNGFLVPTDRPDILADRLQSSWDNDRLRRIAIDVNWKRVRARCDYFKNMERIEAAFNQIKMQ